MDLIRFNEDTHTKPQKIKNFHVFEKLKHINVWDLALREHYRKNSHHPEHFPNVSEMDDLNKKHMLCDLLGSHLGSQWKFDQYWSIPQCASICQNWSKWNIVKNFYKGKIEKSDKTPLTRWPSEQFSSEKITFVIWMKYFLCGKINMDDFIAGLYTFDSVLFYLKDLLYHKYAVLFVGKELFPNDDRLIADLKIHDEDKWDYFMIAVYTLKWIFNEECIHVDDKIINLCFGALINDMILKGKRNIKLVEDELQKLETDLLSSIEN